VIVAEEAPKFRLLDWMIIGVLAVVMVGAPLDQRWLLVFPWLSALAVGLFVARLAMSSERISLQHALPFGGAWLGLSIVGFAMLPSPLPALLAPWLLLLAAIVTGGCLAYLGANWAAWREHGMAVPVVLVAVVFLSFYVSSFLSVHPDSSFLNYARDGAALHLATAVAALVVLGMSCGRRGLLGAYVLVGGLYLTGSVLVALRAQISEQEIRVAMHAASLIRDSQIEGTFGFRAQFPFFHHNRLGYYAMTVALAAMATMPLFERRWVRIACGYVFVVATCAVVLSQTRGAFAAWLVGGIVCVVTSGNLRRFAPFALAAAGVILLLVSFSEPLRGRLISPLDPANYGTDASTISLRRYSMVAAIDGGIERPIAGQGYGWTNFARIYGAEYQAALGDPERKEHAHNAFLEVWGSSGLLAGLAFAGLHLWAMFACWRRRRFDPAAAGLLGLVAGIVVFGLGNTTLHHALGGMTWMLLMTACFRPAIPEAEPDQSSSR